MPASFEPGTRFEYSNTNYVLLELIVENVTKSTLAAEIRRTILTPLALQSTFMEIKEPRPNGFGSFFNKNNNEKHFNDDSNNKNNKNSNNNNNNSNKNNNGYEDGHDVTRINDALGLGDGGLISGAKDLVGFLDGLMAWGHSDCRWSFGNSDYGLGFDCRKSVDLGVAWGHSGASWL
ncbi:unnamed protein product [Polarella glacialis]|uniref:Beta-lactamase-related domain-containing protein n=1 Tax=Polarella glacialis TaxID=89957 RepID=A0A813G9Y4_POLGL|nr:unnamed protein product [Polarella glacialis]